MSDPHEHPVLHICDNCNTAGGIEQIILLEEVERLSERIDPGGIVPSGACKKCGALCYPDWVMERPLEQENPICEPTDYTLKKEHTFCWITVKGFAVYVHTTDEGMIVDVFRDGRADEAPIAATYAYDSDCEHDEEEEEKDG